MDKQTSDLVEIARRHGIKPQKRWRGGRAKVRTIIASVVMASGPLAGLATTTYEIAYDKPTKAMLGARIVASAEDSSGKSLRPLLAYTTFVYLTTTGTNSWPVPADWNNSDNQIECLGSGANGTAGGSGASGNGGGGGAYATVSNVTLTPGGSASYTINVGSDTNFASVCIAKSASGTTGGQAASCTPSTGAFSGGNGGAGNGTAGSNTRRQGGSGGGAAFSASNGSNGVNGGTGVNTVAGNTGGAGGSPGGGAGGSPSGSAGTAGTPGGNGTGWSTPSSAGAGGGGSGGGCPVNNVLGPQPGSAGGLYGGGGGGGCGNPTFGAAAGGAGRQGIIRISYTPLKTFRFRAYVLG